MTTSKAKAGPPVEVGILLAPTDTASVFSGLGFGGVNPGSGQAQAQAVVNAVNREGGLHGHPIVPVYVTENLAATNADAEAQRWCTAWTQDHHVIAVVAPLNVPDAGLSCLTQQGVVVTGGGTTTYDDLAYRTVGNGLFFQTSGLAADRGIPELVDRLVTQRFLTPADRIGALSIDTPVYQRALHDLTNALAAHHLTLTDSASYADGTAGALNDQGITLQFAAKRVDRVIFLDDGSGYLYFTVAAAAQHYQPRYSITSAQSPAVVQSIVSPSQLNGATGFGVAPLADVSPQYQPAANKAERRCEAIMKKAHVDNSTSLSRTTAAAYCDGLFFFQAVYDSAANLTGAAFRASAAQLGDSYQSPLTFATSFAGGRPDGVAAGRDLRYVESCKCFQYVGATYRIP